MEPKPDSCVPRDCDRHVRLGTVEPEAADSSATLEDRTMTRRHFDRAREGHRNPVDSDGDRRLPDGRGPEPHDDSETREERPSSAERKATTSWRDDIDRDRWREGDDHCTLEAGEAMVVADGVGRYWYRAAAREWRSLGWDVESARAPDLDRGSPNRAAATEPPRQEAAERSQRARPPGANGHRRADDRIVHDLRELLDHAMDLDASEVEVRVQNAEVRLSGSVPEPRMKFLIEQFADHVRGVVEVSNHIAVRRPVSRRTRHRGAPL
jgi:hypothetical protein